MGQKQDESFWSGTTQYRLGGHVHWIQAGKAWEDDASWRGGVLLTYDDGTATVAFHTPLEAGGVMDADSPGTVPKFDGEFARAAFDLEEALAGEVVEGLLNVFPDRLGPSRVADAHADGAGGVAAHGLAQGRLGGLVAARAQ